MVKPLFPLLKQLFPICRSITGDGFRKSLMILQDEVPGIGIHEVPSGTEVFDWIVPDEWNIKGGKLVGPLADESSDSPIVADFSVNNLHVVGYSDPVDAVFSLEELQDHLHSREDMPDVIPYVTSYYKRNWGFCLPHAVRKGLKPGKYHAKIDSSLTRGSLTYGELFIPGRLQKEVLLSTYLCHPSLANNELSGPVVAVRLAQWLLARSRKYSYRILFLPETIGSITYLSRHLSELRERVVAGFVLTCLGDDRTYSYLPSRQGDTLADRVALHILNHFAPGFKRYTFLNRGSDERQYCAPGVDLPVCSVMRSMYAQYPEYHTSADNLELVSEEGLSGGYEIIRKCLEALELDCVYKNVFYCEPQMGKRGLYPTLSTVGGVDEQVAGMMNILAYADGALRLMEIAEVIGLDIFTAACLAEKLHAGGVLKRV